MGDFARGRSTAAGEPRESPFPRIWQIIAGFLVAGLIGLTAFFFPLVQSGSAPVVSSGGGILNPIPGPTSPFTVLLLGSDNDAKFVASQVLTQSMILARVDPVTRHVTLLSIPRDLDVPLSTGGSDKIDKAYLHGGADAAIQTVEQDFGVHVDHYAWIGLLGLIHLIDVVGGVDVIAGNPVLDDFYPKDLSAINPYAIERVAVLPGPQHMSGIEALQYVRSRHDDLRSDFGRSVRQQQVLLALRAKAKLLGIADLPDIANAMSGQFTTDMSVTQVGELLPIAGGVSLDNVQQVVLLPPYTSSATVGTQDVLLANWNLILPLVHRYFPAA